MKQSDEVEGWRHLSQQAAGKLKVNKKSPRFSTNIKCYAGGAKDPTHLNAVEGTCSKTNRHELIIHRIRSHCLVIFIIIRDDTYQKMQ